MNSPHDTETIFKVWTYIQEYNEDPDRYTEHDPTPLKDFGSIEAAREHVSLLDQVGKDDTSARILLKQTLHLLDHMTTTQYERGYDKRLRTRITLFLKDTETEHAEKEHETKETEEDPGETCINCNAQRDPDGKCWDPIECPLVQETKETEEELELLPLIPLPA